MAVVPQSILGLNPRSETRVAAYREARLTPWRRSLLYLCHPDIAAELGQVDEHLVPGDAEI
jgi:hypothetical protein